VLVVERHYTSCTGAFVTDSRLHCLPLIYYRPKTLRPKWPLAVITAIHSEDLKALIYKYVMKFFMLNK